MEIPSPVYRSLRPASPWERLGCGGLDKSGSAADHQDYLAPTYSMVWICRGRGGYHDSDGRRYDLSSGMCFQRWPGRRHSTFIDPQQPWQELWIDLGPGLHAALAAVAMLRVEPIVWRPREIPYVALADLHSRLQQGSESELPGCLSSAFQLLTAAGADGQPSASHDPIEKACKLLSAESLGRGDLRSWCLRQGLDYHRFRRQFSQRMGESPGQYRIRRRLDQACALLRSDHQRSISSIAEELGYHSPYEFSAQFKAHFGMPPRVFRHR
ncbi:MAG: AraC family transcriptional regulator [Planctomycetota bacterium]|nr:MAG: AraC family transcriptional regulator [Planctomycetota bacterium]